LAPEDQFASDISLGMFYFLILVIIAGVAYHLLKFYNRKRRMERVLLDPELFFQLNPVKKDEKR
jgi:hypothetical protein